MTGAAKCGDSEGILPSELAQKIFADPSYFPGEPVKLIACDTGYGDDSYAQKLADALAQIARGRGLGLSSVWAPTGYAFPVHYTKDWFIAPWRDFKRFNPSRRSN